MAINQNLLGSIIGAGSQIGGNLLNRKLGTAESKLGQASLDERKREFDYEAARKNRMLGIALPGMLANLGYSGGAIPGLMSRTMGGMPTQMPGQATPPGPGEHGFNPLNIATIAGIAGFALPQMGKLLGGGPMQMDVMRNNGVLRA